MLNITYLSFGFLHMKLPYKQDASDNKRFKERMGGKFLHFLRTAMNCCYEWVSIHASLYVQTCFCKPQVIMHVVSLSSYLITWFCPRYTFSFSISPCTLIWFWGFLQDLFNPFLCCCYALSWKVVCWPVGSVWYLLWKHYFSRNTSFHSISVRTVSWKTLQNLDEFQVVI